MQVDIAQDGVVGTGRVRECDVFECDFALEGKFAIADGFFGLAGQCGKCEDMVC